MHGLDPGRMHGCQVYLTSDLKVRMPGRPDMPGSAETAEHLRMTV
jgi:hypothetical protein